MSQLTVDPTPGIELTPEASPKPRPNRHGTLAVALALAVCLALALGAGAPVYVAFRNAGYDIFRSYEYYKLVRSTENMVVRTSTNFELRMDKSDAGWASMVLNTAEQAAATEATDLGLDIQQVRAQQGGRRVLLVMYPTKEALSSSFGWPAGENALGAYWAGAIRLLSPTSWLGDMPSQRVTYVYRKDGPVAHELAHMLFDYASKGNYPRWFTEGAAEYEEWKANGFLWIEGDGREVLQSRYTLDQLEDFDSLDDQALAYRQSLLMVAFIKEKAGPDGLKGLSLDLGRRPSFWQVVKERTGLDRQNFEAAFAAWLPKNIDRWSN